MLRLTGLPGWMRGGTAAPTAAQGPVPPDVDERRMLKQQDEAMQAQLDRMNERMKELDAS